MRVEAGQVAVVTGAASGIGRGLAERFVADGLRVAVADVEAESLATVAADLGQRGDVLAVPCNVADGAAVAALRDAVLDRFGRVDIVCNNAGVGAGGPIWELTEADWDWVLGVNLWGVVHGIRTFVPLLVEQGHGHVVNTASMAGLLSAPMMGPYSASKQAVVAISETLRHDLALTGSDVGVSVLCPGWVATRIHESDRNRPDRFGEAAPLGGEVGRGMVAELIESGMPPSEVADHVVRGIEVDRLYVLTHPDMLSTVRTRFDTILAAGHHEPPDSKA